MAMAKKNKAKEWFTVSNDACSQIKEILEKPSITSQDFQNAKSLYDKSTLQAFQIQINNIRDSLRFMESLLVILAKAQTLEK